MPQDKIIYLAKQNDEIRDGFAKVKVSYKETLFKGIKTEYILIFNILTDARDDIAPESRLIIETNEKVSPKDFYITYNNYKPITEAEFIQHIKIKQHAINLKFNNLITPHEATTPKPTDVNPGVPKEAAGS